MDERRVEARAGQLVEIVDDPDVGRVTLERPADRVRVPSEVVDADIPLALGEGHHIAHVVGRDPFLEQADALPPPIHHRCH